MNSSADNIPNRPHRRRGRPSIEEKGKGQQQQQEPSEASRAREAERLLGLGFDDAEDDDEAGLGSGSFPHSLTSASSALQRLLKKLGAGLDDILPSSALSAAAAAAIPSSFSVSGQQGGRLKKILVELRADGEEGRQVEVLTQLCEMLSIGTEDSLGAFSVDSFVPILVGLLNHENNPDIMLLAARALTHLCDVLPSSCSAVVHYGAVPCFCSRLLTIEYMDLAEQSLQALKKISQEHPTACLRAGALMAVLSYLDFFSTGVQRVALSTAANMCRKLPSDASDFVMEAVPLLTNLLNYHDAKILEHASVCLTRIVEAFALSPEKLDQLCSHGLVTQAAGLISVSNSTGQASLSTSTYTGIIRLLSTCAKGSPLAAKTLFLLGISGTIKDILSGSGLVTGATVSPALTRPADQMYEIVNLADELLPPLPFGIISLPAYSHVSVKGSSVKKPSGKKGESGSIGNEVSGREKLLHDHPELLQQFGIDLLPIMTQVYCSSVTSPIRHKGLSVIGKLMYYSSAEMIEFLLGTTNISSFLAGSLAWKDPQMLIPALQIAEILMEKLPMTFSKTFVREGVVHAVESLILPEHSSSLPSEVSLLDKDIDSGTCTTSRSRRNRRRSGSVNTGNNLLDEVKGSHTVTASPSSSTAELSNTSLRDTVGSRAKLFRDKYFPSVPGSSDVGVTDDLLKLRTLCAKLNTTADIAKTKAKGKSKAIGGNNFDALCSVEEQLDNIIAEILFELSKGNSVSTFEFIGSGVIAALLSYFSCGTFGRQKVSEQNLSKLRYQAFRRYKAFISVALPSDVVGNKTPMALLVQKLQDALFSLERFPVVLSYAGRTPGLGGSRLSSGLSTLSQPFKLRLCRAQGEKSLRDYSSNIVLIDPLASLAAVEEFLWPRVQQSESILKPAVSSGNSFESGAPSTTAGALSMPSSAQSVRRSSTRLNSSPASSSANKKDSLEGSSYTSKGKGKAVLKSSLDELKGPNARNTARRKAAPKKDVEMKLSHVHSSSEDEVFDVSPVEIVNALMIADDDVSEDDDAHHEVMRGSFPDSVPDRVHDVNLGDADDSSISSLAIGCQAHASSGYSKNISSRAAHVAEFRSPSTFGSQGAMSFAAAAMAGLASGDSHGFRCSQDRAGLLFKTSANEHCNKLIFTAGGMQLSKHLTLYQVVQRQVVHCEVDGGRSNGFDLPNNGSRLWSDVFTITYQKADKQVDKRSVGYSESALTSSKSYFCGSMPAVQCTLLDSMLQGELLCDLEKSNETYNILALLRLLEGLNQLAPRLRLQAVSDDFAAGKVDTLDGLYEFGTTIPLEEFVNTFGPSRALHRVQQQQDDNNNSSIEREVRVGRLQRQKVRVSRKRILDSAAKVMEMFSSQKAVLEVEYFGEVGTGLGPTLEFYTLLSHDLQTVGLGLWRSFSSDDSGMKIDGAADALTANELDYNSLTKKSNLIQSPLGLFPRPWPPNTASSEGSKFFRVVEHFLLVGRVMAKALQDGRLLDLPLSTAFYKLLLGQELDLYDILSFDAEFGKILQELQVLVERKRFLESCSNDEKQIEHLCFQGVPIEDLCLSFTLPGYNDYVLKEGGENTVVNIYNLEEYISLVVDATVKTGIMRQVESFKAGFNQVFDISSLQIFAPQELDLLICGRQELWKLETLVDHIKFDHGYTAKSPAVVNLLEIMTEFTPEQQHAFCQFVTGAPRLPPGGLAALNPKLTIVRKLSTAVKKSNAPGAIESVDDDLPSVMTCANYLKLPPYSTKEVMHMKLLYAINEGQGSFDLS
ncbi:hypothetical protein E2562_035966 [Oryza meyeriana var. granulata]|uniref:HECT-type E3 ubiquitin transferase n=1 Tax=Oryza meyeriana var. granulata TaxID=110450 RepID=A0A6G1F1S5_9ORYZ|nr:hypothetical protein E2562_035966 [Oryza meyeriana var. granulata]